MIPWTDLIYAIAPNGRTLTYAVAPPAVGRAPVGVAEGFGRERDLRRGAVRHRPRAAGRRAVRPRAADGLPGAAGLRPRGRRHRLDHARDAGEPYDDPRAPRSCDSFARYHSALLHRSRAPAAAAVRGNRLHRRPLPGRRGAALRQPDAARYPRSPALALRSATSGTSVPRTSRASGCTCCAAIHALVRPLPARSRAPRPAAASRPTRRPAPAAPRRAGRSGARLRRLARAARCAAPCDGPQTVTSARRRSRRRRRHRPGRRRRRRLRRSPPTAAAPGTATYDARRPRARSFTLIGAPTIIARLRVSGAARRTPSSPPASGTWPRAAARRPWSPAASTARGEGRNVWQLHPAAWRFARGHPARLELLGSDAPFGRPSNGAFEVELRASSCGCRCGGAPIAGRC